MKKIKTETFYIDNLRNVDDRAEFEERIDELFNDVDGFELIDIKFSISNNCGIALVIYSHNRQEKDE